MPSLTELPNITADDIVVFELSSFQLWDIERSPHVAVVLMIEPDHLDIHASVEEYISAKANIVKFQTEADVVVYNQNNQTSRNIADQSNAGTHAAYPFDLQGLEQALVIPGQHNVDNACAAVAAVRHYVSDEAMLREGLHTFTGLPHRLKFVRDVDGVKYYDDSIATTPGSAIAALETFQNKKVLILGGYEKGVDYDDLMKQCKQDQATVIAMGANRGTVAELCAQYGVNYSLEPGDMRSVVAHAKMEAVPGSIVILSPAAASFDMFKNYSARGDAFIDAVNAL